MAQFVYGADFAVTALARAFFNIAPSNPLFTSLKGSAGTTTESQYAFANQFAAQFDSLSDEALATRVLTNMGILPSTDAEDVGLETALTTYFGQVGKANRGIVVLQLSSILASLENETGELAVYADSAAKWNNEINSSFQYSANASNTANYEGDFPTTPDNQGQTFTLTTGTDIVTGTGGNDTFYAGTGLSADGATKISTTNALDQIDGAGGVNTLVIENTGGVNTLTGNIKNIQNLTFVGAGKVNDDQAVDLSNFSGLFTLSQTTDTAVAVNNVKGQTLALNKVADSTTLTASLDAAQSSVAIQNTAAAGSATVSVSGTKLNTVNVATDKTATGKNFTVTDSGNTTKTFNVDASGAAAVTVNSSATENINIKGAGLVTLTAGTAPSKTLSSVDSTGGVTYAATLGNNVLFTGGAGKDSIQLGATTKSHTMGAGDDVVALTAALGTGGKVDGGEGMDTLSMAASLAVTLNADTKFNAQVSNFEKLALTGAASESLNLTNLAGLNYVSVNSATDLKLNNYATNGTLEITGAATKVTAVVKDAASNDSDVFNIVAKAAASKNVGTVVVADVETINIDADDTATAPAKDGSVTHTLTVTGDKATKIVVTGDAALNLTLTGSTKVAEIDASANEAGITTNLSVASGIKLTGTAGVDTITLGQLSVVSGGEGKDAFIVTTPTNGNTYATITDFAVGETIQFTDGGAYIASTTLGSKITLAGTAAFADYLQAAASGTTAGEVTWFQYGGDTYVVNDASTDAVFVNGVDEIVKLTGTLDLSKAGVDANGLLTYAVA